MRWRLSCGLLSPATLALVMASVPPVTLPAAASSDASRLALVDACPIAPPVALATAPTSTILASQVPDTSAYGTGRFALCLEDGTVRRGRATCHWNDARTGVMGLNAFPVRIDRARWQASLWVSKEAMTFALEDARTGRGHSTEHGGAVSVETEGFRGVRVETLGATGNAYFLDVRTRRSQDPTISGRFTWACDAAPPLRAGTSVATMTFTLGAPFAGTHVTDASCSWLDVDGLMTVQSIDGEPIEIDRDRSLAMRLGLQGDRLGPTLEAVLAHRSEHSGVVTYADSEASFIVQRDPGDRAGAVRILSLWPTSNEGEPLGPPGDPGSLQAFVRWDCGTPPTTAEAATGSSEPLVVGTATLRTADGSTTGGARCRIAGDGDGRWVGWFDATIPIGESTGRLTILQGRMAILVVLSDAGDHLGDLLARPTDPGGWAEGSDGTGSTPELAWIPGTLVAPPPLDPTWASSPLQASIEWSCPLREVARPWVGPDGVSPR